MGSADKTCRTATKAMFLGGRTAEELDGSLSGERKVVDESQTEALQPKSTLSEEKTPLSGRELSAYCTKYHKKGDEISNYDDKYVYF